jgi:heptosyltransferase III
LDVLFLTATRIGDAVLSTGLLAYILDRYPEARLTIAAGPAAAPLFEAVPRLERLIVVEKQPASLHWVVLWRTLLPTRWDLVVDLRGSAIAWLLRAGERRVQGKGNPAEHRVRQLARLFGLDPPPTPRLWTAPRHDETASRLVPGSGPLIAIGPAANWRGKQWRAERFAELAARLAARGAVLEGARIAVMAAAHEREQAVPLLQRFPSALDLVGRLDLLTAAALLRRTSLFVGNDTGLMHMAAAAGAPTLGLFGPSLEQQYGPWGERTEVARTTLSHAELTSTPGFDHRTTGTLMDTLTVDMVEAAALRLWSRVGAPARAAQ